MSAKEPVDEPRREKQTMDGPQEEFIEDAPPSNSHAKAPESHGNWEDSWRPEDKAMESAENEAMGIHQNDEEERGAD